jgi:hypothetical protein
MPRVRFGSSIRFAVIGAVVEGLNCVYRVAALIPYYGSDTCLLCILITRGIAKSFTYNDLLPILLER